jgi:WD40 repeat protein
LEEHGGIAMDRFLAGRFVFGYVGLVLSAALASADVGIKAEFDADGVVTKMVFSPDGSLIAVASAEPFATTKPVEVRLYSSKDAKLVATLKHKKTVNALVFDPGNTFLISGSDDGECLMWSLKEHKQIASLESSANPVYDLAITPDGNQLFICGSKSVVEVWDLAKRKLTTTFATEGERVISLSLSRDGKMLAGGGLKGTIRFWDLQTMKEFDNERKHDERVFVTFRKEGRQLISCGADSQIVFWDQGKGGWSGEPAWGTGELPYPMALSPDSRVLAVGLGSGEVMFFDLSGPNAPQTDAAKLKRFRMTRVAYQADNVPITAIAFHPKNGEFLSAGAEGKVRIWSEAPAFKK